jgi:hypothetical protein
MFPLSIANLIGDFCNRQREEPVYTDSIMRIAYWRTESPIA